MVDKWGKEEENSRSVGKGKAKIRHHRNSFKNAN